MAFAESIEKEAKSNMEARKGGQAGATYQNSDKLIEPVHTNQKLAEIAGTSHDTDQKKRTLLQIPPTPEHGSVILTMGPVNQNCAVNVKYHTNYAYNVMQDVQKILHFTIKCLSCWNVPHSDKPLIHADYMT